MVMVEATVIRLQKVTYISDKRRILPYYLRTCRCKEWSTKMKIETCLFPSKFLVSCWVFVTSKSVWKALQDHPSPSLTCSSSWAEDNLHIFRQMTLTRGTSSSITNRPFGEKESISSRPPTYTADKRRTKAARRTNFDSDPKTEELVVSKHKLIDFTYSYPTWPLCTSLNPNHFPYSLPPE